MSSGRALTTGGSPAPISRGFLIAAGCAGTISGSAGVALPLLAVAHGASASTAADLIALFMFAFAPGAGAASPLVSVLGARNLVSLGLAAAACGLAALLAGGSSLGWLVLSAVLDGGGLGCFWVGSQVTMGRRAGTAGAERRFVRHYVAYVIGTATGAAATGLAAQLMRTLGLSDAGSLRLAVALPIVAGLLGLAAWPPARAEIDGRARTERAHTQRARPQRARSSLAVRGIALQLPDVLLVAALAVLAPLAPVILVHSFHFSAAAVGIVSGGLAAAKIAGSLTAERTTSRLGRRWSVTMMLVAGATCTLLLAPVRAPALFLTLLFGAVLAIGGAWPVVVEAALARIEPEQRHEMVVAWNMREYTAVAIATAAGGWLLSNVAGLAWLFVLSAVLLAASAAISHSVLRRPVRAMTIAVAADAAQSCG